MPNTQLLDFSGPLLQIVRNPVLRCVGRCKDMNGYSITGHSHPNTMEMLYIVEGTGTVQVEGTSYPLGPGMIALYNPGITHSEVFDRNSPTPFFYNIKFNEFVISGLPPSCLLPNGMMPTVHAGQETAGMQTLMSLLYAEAEGRRLGYEQIAQNLLMSIVLLTLRVLDKNHAYIEKAEPDCLIVQIQQYFERHFAEELSMQEVADQFHISYYYLSHRFKKHVGVSPSKYISALRINEACRLLSTSKLPIYRVAEMVGYANQSNFQAQFKQYKGMSPLHYRAYYDQNELTQIDSSSRKKTQKQDSRPME